jgi:hypothetical protein
VNKRKGFHIFHENLVGVQMLKKEVVLNKPIYIGSCVLDQSKYLMYDFHYNFMMRQFAREDIDLMFTDTDSLCYHVRGTDPYEIMYKHKQLFDTSDYSKDHKLFDTVNKKVIGKFKDEANGKPMTEFVGIRSKMYSFMLEGQTKKKCKGVKGAVVKNDLSMEDFTNTVLLRQPKCVQQSTFRSHRHQVYTEVVTKKALAPEDDKVYICDDNIHTYTLGHYRTRKENV